MPEERYLQDVAAQFLKLRELAEKAIVQVPEKGLFSVLTPEANSIAIIVKHMAGNMRSRWTDFLTSDGEKPDRNRDTEFELEKEDTRASLMQRWEAGWRCLFGALTSLNVKDLMRTVYIRTEPHSVLQAINRQLTHCACHVGQIVFLARHFAGEDWQSLSIPRGESEEFNARMRSR
jgi:hypothetical protein